MGGLFSKKNLKESRITEQDKAILALKQQRDKLKQYQKKIQLNLEKERQVAKELLKNGKKEKAMSLLKKKRLQEQLLNQTDGQLDNLEQMVQDIEFAQIQSKVVEGLKYGNECLDKMHKLLSIEDVEKIMEETQEGIEYQREIDAILGTNLSQEDEDAILSELEEIKKGIEMPSATINEPENNFVLPDVPSTEPGAIEGSKRKQKEMVAA
ncbi:LOW QUALITY PROTEIN: charged multivesicular body protein 6-A-like [Xenia sp. Carnegie-2017]|uniref:LOW QUALITY PROTEIN: charged multivesicular body protein 6-A-like n=1 Tax=Xenia sp. Carnegie-2017 TaxID=2897299 RepID=UPI001F04BC04|nr:LOW QUALITY PROTEIN: charged multivesicular body protein 6-A-like [Xenia sp. Carnegie-2017]